MSLMVNNVQINTAYLGHSTMPDPVIRSRAALFKAEQTYMRSLPTMGTEVLHKGFPEFLNDFHLMNCLRIVRASGLALEAPDGAMLTALGPDIRYLLDTDKFGEGFVP